MKINPNSPAFTIVSQETGDRGLYSVIDPGMTIRAYMATKFLAAMITRVDYASTVTSVQEDAAIAIYNADILIAELNKEKST